MVTRREALGASLAVFAESRNRTADVDWHDAAAMGIEGKGWQDTESPFDRLPARAKGKVPDSVWGLSKLTAGLCVRFRTDSPSIHLRMDLLSGNLAMPHMSATGVSGFDLYRREGLTKWQWVKQAMPSAQHIEAELIGGLAPGMHEYVGYLPLYNGVTQLSIGSTPGSRFEPIKPDTRKPVVFYGTSICQGACASRPGIAYSALLGRMLNQPVINLGFSGSGRMDSGVVELLSELDPSVFVIDCLPNMTAELVKERTEPLVQRLRLARPDTSILLVEDRTFAQAAAIPSVMQAHKERRAALRSAYGRLVTQGVRGLSYLRGDRLLGNDSEGTTDGSHPNDLGMMRYAEALRPALTKLLHASNPS